MNIKPAHIQAFATPDEFGNWLAQYHAQSCEIWLNIQKTSSSVTSVTWSEAVVEALAWGWIDGIKKANNESSWFQRFTPRKPSSKWSRRNRDHAKKLIADGRMRPAGLKAVNAARSDGRWDSAYAGSSDMELPKALLKTVARNATAKKTFDGLSRAQFYSIYLRLQNAKKEETRKKFMKELIAKLSHGEVFH
jgi:uncharacterized protein YdeI (YjbR/CyaY-like superfamily)